MNLSTLNYCVRCLLLVQYKLLSVMRKWSKCQEELHKNSWRRHFVVLQTNVLIKIKNSGNTFSLKSLFILKLFRTFSCFKFLRMNCLTCINKLPWECLPYLRSVGNKNQQVSKELRFSENSALRFTFVQNIDFQDWPVIAKFFRVLNICMYVRMYVCMDKCTYVCMYG